MINLVDYRIHLSRSLNASEATHLRGYFGNIYSEEVEIHHHGQDGKLIYDYPRVQFKVLNRTAHLIGIAEGTDLISRLWAEVDQMRIGNENLPILKSELSQRKEPFGEADEMIEYQFLTLWLCLNQVNHKRYEECRNDTDRKAILQRILIGNCLSVAKSLGYRVQQQLVADVSGLYRKETRLKGVPMIAFSGRMRLNFHLPDRLGIGKSVSRGFGTIERVI